MTIHLTLTWDLASGDGGPQRPSLAAMGEAALVDDEDFPPVAPTMPTSPMLNQWQRQLAAQGKVVPALIVSVRFSGGAPSVYKFTTPGDNLVLADITVTDNGDGDTTLSWPANKLPVSVAEPMASINGSTSALAPAAEMPTALSVRVRTWNASGVAADRAFTVQVF